MEFSRNLKNKLSNYIFELIRPINGLEISSRRLGGVTCGSMKDLHHTSSTLESIMYADFRIIYLLQGLCWFCVIFCVFGS